MNLISNTILREKKRIEYMLAEYETMLKNLPKGTICEKNNNGNIYYYLKYRDGKKVISKYIGKEKTEITSLLEKRKHIEIMINSLEEELAIAEKALGGII